MYKLVYSRKVKRQLKKLEKEISSRIINALERCRIRPETYFERLVGVKAYKLRVGNYRIIADLIHEKLIVLVIEVGHRKNIYKKK